VLALDVIEKLAALAHHLEQAATRVVVLLVRLEMLGQAIDPLGQDGDLDFRRAGVVAFGGVVFDDLGFRLDGQRHRDAPFDWSLRALRPGTAMAGMSSSQVANKHARTFEPARDAPLYTFATAARVKKPQPEPR